MVKKRISASVDGETIRIINRILKNGKYRNKSHVIEDAIAKFEEVLENE